MMAILAGGLAILIGLTLGLLGGGGSILTVPVFVYVLGIEPKTAIAMSLPVVGAAALVGAIQRWRQGHVALATAIPFGLAAMASAYAAARLARDMNGHEQLVIFAGVMLAAAVSMLRHATVKPGSPGSPDPAARPRWWLLLPVGVGVGALTGLVGAGGGFLIVPALVIFARISMLDAIGTSLLVIAMNTVAGSIGYIGVVDLQWPIVLGFAGLMIAGILAGSALVTRIPQAALKRIFALLLFFVASLMLWQYGTL
jgi:uncharacterized membrane protein YfcA